MQIIPAIDIIDGKCVRLVKGDYAQQTTYNHSPVEQAKEFEANGIKFLHLVDLDGAKKGAIQNIKVLEDIAKQTNLKIDFGGGVKSSEDVKVALNAGASQITAGSIAVKNPKLVKQWVNDFGADKIILGADVMNEKIMINGWQTESDYNIYEFIKDFQQVGVNRVISTDVNVDGMLTGPSIALYQKIQEQFGSLELVASGGVSSTDDLDKLKALNVAGVIIGKAIYENRISLKELRKYVD